ncbi:hypothetical protein [Acidovorax sp. Root219]|uniref:hypothetical protein n=1 Tax=Acidovorax sp. Root219 TaxID=1736493 RepID=UPI00070B9D9F|nr:hypothetical protein [Acidovorax sp. Root219]KRC36008.1 hypothetical protein ASE28_00185 [Acidovorax sp. Root219]
MDLMKLMRSLEEFVFEAIALLFFYPRTLLRIVFKPLQAMEYAEHEEASDKPLAYDDAVSPPLLLLITLLLTNGVAMALHVAQASDAPPLAKELLDSPQNLLLFRSLLFSLVPLTAAVLLLRRRRQAASRTTLRPPFFAQCYLTSPFALVVSLGLIATQMPGRGFGMAGGVACAMAFVWMVGIQAAWFRAKLGVGRLAALGMGLGLLVWACAWVLVAAVLVAIF